MSRSVRGVWGVSCIALPTQVACMVPTAFPWRLKQEPQAPRLAENAPSQAILSLAACAVGACPVFIPNLEHSDREARVTAIRPASVFTGAWGNPSFAALALGVLGRCRAREQAEAALCMVKMNLIAGQQKQVGPAHEVEDSMYILAPTTHSGVAEISNAETYAHGGSLEIVIDKNWGEGGKRRLLVPLSSSEQARRPQRRC
jgi:hypothetical protein